MYGSGTRYEQSASATGGRIFGSRTERIAKSAREVADEKRAQAFAAGDRVDHKVFGRGTVVAVHGDELQIRFEKSGQTKKLLRGYAPIVKIDD